MPPWACLPKVVPGCLFATTIANNTASLCMAGRRSPCLLCAAEIETFGVSHSALGAALCQGMGFVQGISDGVRTPSFQ